MGNEHYPVIIVGAGPVGLLIALRMGKAGIKALLLERNDDLPHTTRATVYQPVVLEGLKDMGLLDLVKDAAYLNRNGVEFRDMTGKLHATMPIGEDEYILLLGQARMARLLLNELKKYPSVEVRWNHQIVGVEQAQHNPQEAKLMVHSNDRGGDEFLLSADWVIGTDGANSSVRRTLCIPFEGFSYNEFLMIGADVYYPFDKANDWSIMNFMLDPEDWAVVIYTAEDKNGKPGGDAPPLWRVAYSEPADLSFTPEDINKRAKERIKKYMMGKEGFELARAEPYQLHQRCAAQAKKGRVCLAGDALHSNNPIGGLGLTTGILDAFAYGNALVRVIDPKHPKHAGEELMMECANTRCKAWLETTNKISVRNLKRLSSEKPEDVKEREEFFAKLKVPGFGAQAKHMMDEMRAETFK